ncbi:MAG TPA: substrate-binding domain-containing protein [Pseudonocardiaceae bacterium]
MRRFRRPAALVSAGLVLAAAAMAGPGATAAFADVAIYASGSTWSANAMDQWTREMANRGVQIQFNANSSGQGRNDFALNQNDFANSDIPFQGQDKLTGQPDNNGGRPFAYMPIVAGGTALMYQLHQGINQITNVRLSGQTIVKIFTGQITNWSDPAITADMNGHVLPAKKIQVVVESNGSGTTAQFTDWMARQYPALWGPYEGVSPDKAVPTSYYPVNSPNITAQNGDSQVAQTITSTGYDGAIGYVQYSYAQAAIYPSVKVENAAHYFTAPNPYNVAVALTKAQINTSNPNDPTTYLTQDLSQVYTQTDPRSYPLSSYSYSIIPTGPTDVKTDVNKAQTFLDFARYFMCQGQDNMPTLGYSPLTINLVAEGFAQVKRFSHIDQSKIGTLDPTQCNNPTYYPQDPTKNRLAQIDPAPPACDQAGQGPCGADNNGNPAGGGSGGPGGHGAGGAAGSGGPAAGTTTAAPGGIDPNTGLPNGSAGAGGGQASASELAAFRNQGMNKALGVVAGVEVVLVLLVPALVARAISRRRARRDTE